MNSNQIKELDILIFNANHSLEEINCSNNRIVKFNAKSLNIQGDCILDFRNNIEIDDILMVSNFLLEISKISEFDFNLNQQKDYDEKEIMKEEFQEYFKKKNKDNLITRN